MTQREGIYRVRLPKGQKREFRTVIRHSDEEYAIVESMAKAQNISRARLYERALRARGVVEGEHLAEISLKMEAALRMIGLAGTNLNQAAKVANSTGDIHGPQLVAAADMVDRYLKELVRLLRTVSDTVQGASIADRVDHYDNSGDDDVDVLE